MSIMEGVGNGVVVMERGGEGGCFSKWYWDVSNDGLFAYCTCIRVSSDKVVSG